MTPTGHTATSGALGYMVYSLTGSAPLGHATAFAAHLPADWLINEFWQWGGGTAFKIFGHEVKYDHLRLVLFEIPAITMLLICGIWCDWRALLFGFVGNVPDLIDTGLNLLGRPAIFPCHPGSKPWHLEPFFGMLSLKATAIADTILAVMGSVGVWWLQR